MGYRGYTWRAQGLPCMLNKINRLTKALSCKPEEIMATIVAEPLAPDVGFNLSDIAYIVAC
jgi:hypothetical protein